MKYSVTIAVLCSILLFECNDEQIMEPTKPIDTSKKKEFKPEKVYPEDTSDCDFIFDTINHPDYRMHKLIMAKFHNPSLRKYYFDKNDDTINHFLLHQDVSTFIGSLKPPAEDNYYKFTNKVVLLILSEDPAVLDYGLHHPDQEQMAYFFEHIQSPLCYHKPLSEIAQGIEKLMDTPTERAEKNKNHLLQALNAATKHKENQ